MLRKRKTFKKFLICMYTHTLENYPLWVNGETPKSYFNNFLVMMKNIKHLKINDLQKIFQTKSY